MDYPSRLSLARLPTPLQPLDRLGAELGVGQRLWIKRDDLTGSTLSGNKVRKLEFVAAHAIEQGNATPCRGRKPVGCLIDEGQRFLAEVPSVILTTVCIER